MSELIHYIEFLVCIIYLIDKYVIEEKIWDF